VSANTYVTKRLWRLGRQVLAGFAGAVVSTTGLTSAALAAQQLAGFDIIAGLGQIDLIAAPAGQGALADHSSYSKAASLTDPALDDGLQPGESAYFGYDLALRGGGASSAWVRMNPVVGAGDGLKLTYEVRHTSDVTQCRTAWSSAATVVASRTVDGTSSEAFLLTPGSDGEAAHLHLCIRVVLDASATQTQTGSITWRFTAAAE
jgi:hypothetical protein